MKAMKKTLLCLLLVLSMTLAMIPALAATTPAGTELKGAFTSFFGPRPLQLLGVVALTSLGTWGLPQMVGKFYAIKDEKAITKGTVISTFFGLVVAGGCYFLGGFGRLYANSIELNAAGNPASFDAIIPAMLHSVEESMGGAGAWWACCRFVTRAAGGASPAPTAARKGE